jgi:hypothetical protein
MGGVQRRELVEEHAHGPPVADDGSTTGMSATCPTQATEAGLLAVLPYPRLLEMRSDRFGAFEAIANSSIKLARVAPEEELAMDTLVAEAVLEFAVDLQKATAAAAEWLQAHA